MERDELISQIKKLWLQKKKKCVVGERVGTWDQVILIPFDPFFDGNRAELLF